MIAEADVPQFQSRVAAAVLRLMRPLARTVLRFGISSLEFDQLARRAFVAAASEDYGIRGRPANTSRIAAMTGISRKEVRRLRQLSPQDFEVPLSKRNRAAEILHYWHTDPRFLDADGQPCALPYRGAEPSFASLVRRAGRDLSVAAARRELLHATAIEQTPDGALRALKRDFVPAGPDARLIEGLQFGLRGLLDTVLFNATRGRRGPAKFQREVHCDAVPADVAEEIRAGVNVRLSHASEQLDSYLSSQELPEGEPGEVSRVSVGFYYFEHPSDE
jgi:hypothetical protein